MVWAFITDVIDYHQYKTGLREDGTVYGVNSFARKVGQACAGAVGGFAGTHWLPIVYNRWSHPISLVQERIYTMANLLPAFCLFVSAIILLVGYPLNRSKLYLLVKN